MNNEVKNTGTAYAELLRWLNDPRTDEATKSELYNIKENNSSVEACFASPMSFGTAGLRSIMGAGIARMNIYTVAQATRGVAALVLSADGASRGVAIAYDSRNNSSLFARTAACVLADYGIKSYFFESIRPTPELSFAVLNLGCIAGINVTASHNPKEYNGYKVYWSDGAQLPPEHAAAVASEMKKADVLDLPATNFDKATADGMITVIGAETDAEYLKNVLACRIDPDIIKKYGNSLSLVYTPLHGTGYRLVPAALKAAGIDNLYVIPEQAVPDGNFPTVESPNPENPACFRAALGYISASSPDTDVIIATDPDGDRLGVAVKNESGEFIALSGNRIGALLIDYIIKARKKTGSLPANACAVRSVVSSELFDEICHDGGVTPVTVLTGFKYIGEKIQEYAVSGEHTFIFGYEESQGFLSGGYVRDKDGVAASLLIAEAASYYKSVGKTLYQALADIFARYGYHDELTVSVAIGGAEPMKAMKAKMESLRSREIASFDGFVVAQKGDYLTGIITDTATGVTRSSGLPASDMLYWKTTDSTAVLIRPSGTEPKVKAYILASGKDASDVGGKLTRVKEEVVSLFTA